MIAKNYQVATLAVLYLLPTAIIIFMTKAKQLTPKPKWLKIRLNTGGEYQQIKHLINDLSLHTVCQEAKCPNIFECWSSGTATFMIAGEVCTRSCGFCAVSKGVPVPSTRRTLACRASGQENERQTCCYYGGQS